MGGCAEGEVPNLTKSHSSLVVILILSYQNSTWDAHTDSVGGPIVGDGGRNEIRSSSGNRMSG